MSYFHTTVSSDGHSYESIEMGNNQPMSSYSDPIADPDMVAPRQHDITTLDNNGHHAVDINAEYSGYDSVDKNATNIPFLFSTQCFQSMAQHFLPCNIFMNTICDLFERKNGKRTENIIPKEEDISGLPFSSEVSVSTTDSTNELSPVMTNRTKRDQTGYAVISIQYSLIQSRKSFGDF